MIRKLTIVLLLLTVVALMGVPGALATPTIKNNFTTLYGVGGTRIDSCDTCHIPGQTPSFSTLNPYGKDLFNDSAYATNVTQSMINVEPKDSDNDGFSNINEIHNLTFPGNSSDFPPKIISFAPPSPVTSIGTPATQKFNVTLNQVVDTATWRLDGNVSKTDNNVNASDVTLTTSVVGTHTVTFTAQRTGDGSAMQNWTWNVSAPITRLKSITVSPSTATLNVSETKVFTATALDQNNTPMAGVNINWTSSNMTVGTVSPSSATTNMNGTATTTFTALALGTAMVNATSGNVSGTATVTVVTKPPSVNGTIAGKVTNASSGLAISGATVTANGITATTNATGNYSISIAAGTYTVTASATGYQSNTTTGVVVTQGNVTTQNFALTPILRTFNISGFKINDTNGNGVWNPGEMGIPNWKIMLLNDTGVQLANTSTNASGFYQFMSIFPGKYNIAEEMKPGFTPTNATSIPVTVENMDVMNVNFTNQVTPPVGTFNISGFKLNSATGSGIPGWNITIKNATMQKSMLTGADGSYKFTGLVNGTYNVSEEMKPGFTPVGATFRVITIENMDVMNVNFTNTLVTANGSISGNVINVATGKGLPNVTIRLVGIVGMGVDTKTIRMEIMTDSMGRWMFENLPAGRYIIIEQLPKGFIPVSPPVMNIMLAQGQNSMNNNFTVNPISALTP